MAKKKTKKAKHYIAQAIRKGIGKRRFPYTKEKGRAYHWTYVLRATDPKKRELIAKAMERAVANNEHIRYSNTKDGNAKLYDAVKSHKFDPMSVKKVATTNCCNLASVACRYAGIHTPRKSSSRTLPNKWQEKCPGAFKKIRYRHGTTKLKRGDILVATVKPKVHTAVYLG